MILLILLIVMYGEPVQVSYHYVRTNTC